MLKSTFVAAIILSSVSSPRAWKNDNLEAVFRLERIQGQASTVVKIFRRELDKYSDGFSDSLKAKIDSIYFGKLDSTRIYHDLFEAMNKEYDGRLCARHLEDLRDTVESRILARRDDSLTTPEDREAVMRCKIAVEAGEDADLMQRYGYLHQPEISNDFRKLRDTIPEMVYRCVYSLLKPPFQPSEAQFQMVQQANHQIIERNSKYAPCVMLVKFKAESDGFFKKRGEFLHSKANVEFEILKNRILLQRIEAIAQGIALDMQKLKKDSP